MKKYYRMICLLLCAVLSLCMVACTKEPAKPTDIVKQDTISVVFSEKLLNVAEVSPEDWVESLNNLGSGQYVGLQVSGSGKTVTLEITEAQKEFWLSVVAQGLQKLRNDFQAINSTYDICHSEDFSSIDFYYNLDLAGADAIYYVIYAEVYCAFGQLLNGADAASWVVNFNIYNSDTQKLVTSGSSDTGLSYESSDWEASK